MICDSSAAPRSLWLCSLDWVSSVAITKALSLAFHLCQPGKEKISAFSYSHNPLSIVPSDLYKQRRVFTLAILDCAKY